LVITVGLIIARESVALRNSVVVGWAAGGILAHHEVAKKYANGGTVFSTPPDSYEQTEHSLALMEVDLHLTPEQKSLGEFTDKVRVYASDIRASMPGQVSRSGTPISGCNISTWSPMALVSA
jgi:hypothetical protein